MRVVVVALCVSSAVAFAQAKTPEAVKANPEAEKAAVSAADAWLKVVDAGKYADSWTEGASYFKGAITQDAWKAAVTGVRGPLGKVASRKVKSKTYAEKLPGAPDGKYVVIQYDTKFENKADSIETVTPTLDKDGKWRVSGYYLK